MSMSLESTDGLLRHVLVGGFIPGSPICHRKTEAKISDDRLSSTNQNHTATPSGSPSLEPASSLFALPTFSPLKLNHRPSISSPTSWTPQRRNPHLCPSISSPLFASSPQKPMSPILNLAKIDETKILKTPLYAETFTPEHHAVNVNPNIPETVVISATPQEEKSAPDFGGCHDVKQQQQLSPMADLDNVSLRLSSLSMSPALDRSMGLVVSQGEGAHKRYLRFRRSDITMGKMIGKGGFGCVYEGSIGGSPLAVKIVQKRRGSGIHREILQAERLAFKLDLRHENIVGIYGVNLCEELRGDALILMELITSRSLQALLDDTTNDIKFSERLGYALQVARGLNYLHDNWVAHLDVKPANVLITSDNVCKLSDFGNLTLTGPHARQEEPEFTQLLGTLPYRAPELMTGLFPSTRADVYSFGITLWQMQTRESPHKSANPHALIYQVVKWDIRPTVPVTENDVIETMYKDLYTSCWIREVEKRPEASEIILSIQNITQHSLMTEPEPNVPE